MSGRASVNPVALILTLVAGVILIGGLLTGKGPVRFFTDLLPGGSASGAMVNQPAPSWTTMTPDGREMSSLEFGGKVVLLNFWATWCPPCREEIPDLKQIQQEFANRGFTVVGLSVDREARKVQNFLEGTPLNYPVGIVGPSISQAYGVSSIPATFLIDQSGKVVFQTVGYSPSEMNRIRDRINELL